jgi:outer membrane biosynthesis protein TonB
MLATQEPSTRTVIKRLLRPVIPALAGLLVFSGTAQADLGTEGAVEAPTVTVEPAPEGTGAEKVPPVTTEPTSGTGGETTPTKTPPEAPVETPPKSEAPAPAETPPPAPEPAPTPEPKPVETHPTSGETGPPPSESPGTDKTPVRDAAEEHERPAESAALPAAAGGGTGATPQAEAVPAASGLQTPTGSEVVKLSAQTAPADEAPPPLAHGRAVIERRAEQRRCALSVLGGPAAATCAGGWMGAPGTAASTPLRLASVAVALGATPGGSSGEGHGGGAADGGRPLSPGPSPPGGAGGGVAAGGTGGAVGLSGFLTLAGLLLLAAPRALRRLRLSCRPYLTAFFVLIPERPG